MPDLNAPEPSEQHVLDLLLSGEVLAALGALAGAAAFFFRGGRRYGSVVAALERIERALSRNEDQHARIMSATEALQSASATHETRLTVIESKIQTHSCRYEVMASELEKKQK